MPATLERPKTPAPRENFSEKDEGDGPFRLVLLDDDDHTYDYVIEMLQKIFIFSRDKALLHAQEVDATGRTELLRGDRGEAEFGRAQIHAFGPDWRLERSKGSMSAVVEPIA